MIDFESDFDEFFIDWTGERYSAGSDDDAGRWQSGATSPLEFRAMPSQPINQGELNLVKLEDGQKVSDVRKTYTPFELFTRGNDVDADIVIDPESSERYEVTQVSSRNELGGHYKVIMVKIQGDSGA